MRVVIRSDSDPQWNGETGTIVGYKDCWYQDGTPCKVAIVKIEKMPYMCVQFSIPELVEIA